MPTQGGWSEGDASFVGRNPPSGAVITYYQRARHLFGPLKLEVLDDKGAVIDTLDATTRRGINRVTWSMQVKPPRAPRGAQIAFNALRGPRLPPGTYTVRLTKGAETFETKVELGMDHRAPYDAKARRAQFDAAMRAHALFGEMSTLAGRIEGARAAAEARAQALPPGDPLAAKLRAAATKLEDTRKKIVATKEGGAITGEERLREHLDQLYGALNAWEGRPARYQLDRLDVLRRELGDVAAELDTLASQDLRPLDEELKQRKLDPIPISGARAEADLPMNDRAVAAAVHCGLSHGIACDDAPRAAAEARGERD
jgi:hypothetical protein